MPKSFYEELHSSRNLAASAPTKDGDNKLPLPGSGLDETHAKALGLPSLGLAGFEQEAPYHSQGRIQDALHGIKHAFVKDETLNEEVQHYFETKMTMDERTKFVGENQAQATYDRFLGTLPLMAMRGIPPRPEAPMHDEIARRAVMLEENLSQEVKSHMSQTDLKRLDNQMKKYPEARGNAVKDYFERLAEVTDCFIKNGYILHQ